MKNSLQSRTAKLEEIQFVKQVHDKYHNLKEVMQPLLCEYHFNFPVVLFKFPGSAFLD